MDTYPPAPLASPDPHPYRSLVPLLEGTRPWVRLLSVLGFVGAGLMVLVGLGVGLVGAATGQPQMLVLVLVYPLMALTYLVPAWFLWKYAGAIGRFALDAGLPQLEEAIAAQRTFWKFVGILTVVGVVLSIVVFLVVVAAGILAGLNT